MRHFLGFRGSAAFRISTADVTPDAVNWLDQTGNGTGTSTTNTVTITGINTSINLSVGWTGGIPGNFTYIKNGAAGVSLTTSPTTISMSNNDTLAFRLFTTGDAVRNVTVTNASDGNTVLDTFTIRASGSAGGGG